MHHPLMSPIAKNPLSGLFEIDQIAFIARSDEDERNIKGALGLIHADWTEDECVAEGFVWPNEDVHQNRAKLMFNYDMGIEVEILRYLEGPNYAMDIPSCSVCHIGMHINKEMEPTKGLFSRKRGLFGNVIQQVETQSHTNQFLIDSGRRYRYTIYSSPILGTNLKTIERIEPEPASEQGDDQ